MEADTKIVNEKLSLKGVKSMKATGIVRRIDDLGRVVVPKEIRRVLRIREGDPLEIYTGNTGEVILKKYSPINELSQFAGEYAETVSKILGGTIIVSDTDQVIAASGSGRKEYADKRIDPELDKIIQSKNRYLNRSTHHISGRPYRLHHNSRQR